MENCLFCRIATHQQAANLVYEDENAVVIQDIRPQAPVHLLVIPRKHFPSLQEVQAEDKELLGHLLILAAQMAKERGLDSRGYRTVINKGPWAGQSVDHLHVHLMGGRTFRWPPG